VAKLTNYYVNVAGVLNLFIKSVSHRINLLINRKLLANIHYIIKTIDAMTIR